MTSLESLKWVLWSSDLTAEHWSQLSLFSNLHAFDLCAVVFEHDREALALMLDRALAALQHCAALSTLVIEGRFVFRTAHTNFLCSFPQLRSLAVEFAQVESLDPLSRAPKLTHLRLHELHDLEFQPWCLRSLVPALPRLTSLTLQHDPDEIAMDPIADAALTAALFARLPLLTPSGLISIRDTESARLESRRPPVRRRI